MRKIIKKDTIIRKLGNLKEYLQELETLSKRPLTEYLDNFEYRRAVERLIQVIVECAIDINTLLVVGLGERPPIDYKESFLKLVTCKIIPKEFVEVLIPFVSLRNRIVHEYEKINNELVYASIRHILIEFKKYRKEITRYVFKYENKKGGNLWG